MPYLGKKPVDFTDVTETQSLEVTEDLNVSGVVSDDLTIREAASQPTFTIQADTTTDPEPRIRLMRGTDDTFGSDNYGDWEIANRSAAIRFNYGANSTTTEQFSFTSTNNYYQTSGNLYVGRDSAGNYTSGERGYNAYAGSSSHETRITARNVADGSPVFLCVVGGTTRAEIEANGDYQSATNSYGSTSDQTLKENIAASGSQWDDIKAVQVKKFSYISDDLDNANMIGVIAQDLETAGMNGLVSEKDGIKRVKYSILYMKAIKALQEAMAKIETLETKVAALEAAD